MTVDVPPLPFSLSGWLRDARNTLLADPKFQTFAARFPLTRAIARGRASAAFDLVSGFVYSQVLLACVELDVFNVLRGGAKSTESLSQALGLEREAVSRLALAACAIGLMERRGPDHFALGAAGASILGNQAITAMIRHHTYFYADMSDPVALLRGTSDTALSRYWAYAKNAEPGALSAVDVASYTALMSASQALVASEILGAYALRSHRRLLDVGGGDGTFLRAAITAAPHIQGMLFDIPPVIEIARGRIEAAGFASRVTLHPGSFFSDELPAGADIVSLIRVLHDHDDSDALAILKSVRRALPNGGVALIAEPMSQTAGASRAADAYFGFYLLAMGSGQARTEKALIEMLHTAGFGDCKKIATRIPLQTSLLIAKC